MIKGLGTKDGAPLLLFGLSRGNCEKLLEGKPIVIDVALAMGGPAVHVFIFGGENEKIMADELLALLPNRPDLHRQVEMHEGGHDEPKRPA